MIIGICGQAGSGKDTAADFLVKDHGFAKVSFADPMKRFCQEIFDFTDEQLWGSSQFRNAPDSRFFRGPRRYSYPEAPAGSVWVPLSNGRGLTLIDSVDFERVIEHRWHLSAKEEGKNTDYVKGPAGVKLHAFIAEPPEGMVVDHVNGDGLDNRRANLRVCTVAENRRNEAKRKPFDASSPFKGVTWDEERSKWSAKITVAGQTKNLGRFDDPGQAALAYDAAARAEFGPFARVNSDIFLTPRYALQMLGTEFGRHCYEPIWVEYALRMAKNLDGLPGRMYTAQRGLRATMGPNLAGVAIPDCRFRNEILAVRNAGGKVIRIVRPGAGLQGAASAHKSETEMNELPDDLFDVILENTGTLERLRQQVSAALTYCMGR